VTRLIGRLSWVAFAGKQRNQWTAHWRFEGLHCTKLQALRRMPALGQTRTFADIRDKSALPLKSGHYANSIYQLSGAMVSLMAPPKPSAAIASAISIAFFSLVCPRRLG
jgi:hypothetical protein